MKRLLLVIGIASAAVVGGACGPTKLTDTEIFAKDCLTEKFGSDESRIVEGAIMKTNYESMVDWNANKGNESLQSGARRAQSMLLKDCPKSYRKHFNY
jgi:hypothetical protein